MQYYFELGREQRLALAELSHCLPNVTAVAGTDRIVLVRAATALPTDELQARLGGTVKIGQILRRSAPATYQRDLLTEIEAYLHESDGRHLGLSFYGQTLSAGQRNRVSLKLKRKLQAHGRRVRFVFAEQPVLSSVVVSSQLLKRGREFSLIGCGNELLIGYTLTCQPWRQWSHYDYGRPERDPERGMLPPKLARMMLNLADCDAKTEVLDPFCGIGTVLQEARRIGVARAIGFDRDPLAIQATLANMAWLEHQPLANLPAVEVARLPLEDVTGQLPHKVATIVTEGNLGPAALPRMSPNDRLIAFRQLQQDYGRWVKILQMLILPQGRIVLALPVLLKPLATIDIGQLVQTTKLKLEDLVPIMWQHHPAWQGQSAAHQITYARPGQIIGRQIIRLGRL